MRRKYNANFKFSTSFVYYHGRRYHEERLPPSLVNKPHTVRLGEFIFLATGLNMFDDYEICDISTIMMFGYCQFLSKSEELFYKKKRLDTMQIGF